MALSMDRYHAVMKMPNPDGQADPCALLLPELLAAIPKHVPVTLPTQGTAMLRYALRHEGIKCREFSLREHLAPDAIHALEPLGVLVLVFPQTLPDRHGEYSWTAGALRLTCQAIVDVARTCCFRMVLQPFIPGAVSLEEMCQDMQAPLILAEKDWGTCLSYLLCKEF
jgi:hypothetical protein